MNFQCGQSANVPRAAGLGWDGLDQHEPEDLGEGLTMNLSMMILEDRNSENDDGVEFIG